MNVIPDLRLHQPAATRELPVNLNVVATVDQPLPPPELTEAPC